MHHGIVLSGKRILPACTIRDTSHVVSLGISRSMDFRKTWTTRSRLEDKATRYRFHLHLDRIQLDTRNHRPSCSTWGTVLVLDLGIVPCKDFHTKWLKILRRQGTIQTRFASAKKENCTRMAKIKGFSVYRYDGEDKKRCEYQQRMHFESIG